MPLCLQKGNVKDSGIPWIGNIPYDWTVKRGKVILSLLNRLIKDDDEVVTCFRDGEVTLRKNRREEGFTISLKEIGYQGIEPGDLVVHGMDGFAGAIGVSDSRGKGTPVLNVMDSKEDKRFLMYYLRSLAYTDVFMALSTGIRVRSCDLRWNKIAELPFVLPNREEQRKISKYLDEQCNKISAIIEETKSGIDEYFAYKDAIVFEYISKGINSSVKMKESGIEWIGSIPVHWEQKPIKRILISRDGGAWGEDPAGDNNDRICMRIADFDYQSGRFKNISEESFTKRNYQQRQIDKLTLNKGDILIEKSGGGEKTPVGRCVLFDKDFDALYANFMDRLIIDTSNVIPEFFVYWMQAMYSKAVTISYIKQTTGIQNLNISSLLEKEVIAFPEKNEQAAIVKKLDIICLKLSTLVQEKQLLISDLDMYKKSLTNDLVTGKIQVNL